VIVPAGRIFANYEALWVFVGNEFAAGMPRSMNWIVGPSRTADLGVPSRLGAHGPARLHLLIVDD
jgi:L-lactate dehydrogenase complex protein LldG